MNTYQNTYNAFGDMTMDEYSFIHHASAGLTENQIAEILNLSPRTIKRDWSVAKAWLRKELDGEQ